MRIGVDARVLAQPELRGISNYLLEIMKLWPNKTDKIFLFIESGQINSNVKSPAELIPVVVPESFGSRIKVWHWLTMPREIKKYNLDLLWCPSNVPLPVNDCKQVLTIHDTLLQEKFRKHSFFNSFFFKCIVPYWTNKYVQNICTVSSFSKNRIMEIFSVQSDRVRVIYNGGPNSVVESEKSKKETRKYLTEKKVVYGRYIYSLGAESFWKNTELLLKAFSVVIEKKPEICLVMSGFQKGALCEFNCLIEKLGISKNVVLLSFVSSELRNMLYSCAEVFVYPSLFEGFGLPPLEAMAVGCPVIASNRASIPEVVGGGGILVDCTSINDIAEIILKVVSDKILQKEMVLAGFKNLARFSWEKSSRAHYALFREVCEK